MHPLLIAHRGESFDAPENTLAAINMAWQKGSTAVEIDIQLTKDNEIVVIHDADTKRVSGKKLLIRKSALKELKTLDVGAYKDEQWENEKIPTLSEVLETVPENGILIIEIKSSKRILEVLKQQLKNSQLKNSQIKIISFNFKTIAKAKQLMPNHEALWLQNLDYYLPDWLCFINKKKIIKKLKKHNLDGINVWSGKLLNLLFIKAFHIRDLSVYTWTVNNPKKAEQLINQGIDGITTDRANWMARQLKYITFK